MATGEAAKESTAAPIERDLADAPCFIERQFPVAKVSMESYKERSAKQSQTLTGLGKWWGRKPLVLVRATILGLLLPASEDPIADRDVFLSLMTMDDEGLLRRKKQKLPFDTLAKHATPDQSRTFFGPDMAAWRSDAEIAWHISSNENRVRLFRDPPTPTEANVLGGSCRADTSRTAQELRSLARNAKAQLEQDVFLRLPYSERLKYCVRPEQANGPSHDAWEKINSHLGTRAASLSELVEQLGIRRFGHAPRVGDSFCGSGAIPFEAARVGCNSFASDLNPVAAMLTWSALNIVGCERSVEEVKAFQKRVFAEVDRQICSLGTENNARGWRAEAFLYCVEVPDPESGWMIPLAPAWIIGEKPSTVAKLVPDAQRRRYRIEIVEHANKEAMIAARESRTVSDFRIFAPGATVSTPLGVFDRRIRRWERDDIDPRPDDVFQERLFCIRWIETYYERIVGGKRIALTQADVERIPESLRLIETGELKLKERRHYCAADDDDLARERRVRELLLASMHDWQRAGFLPSRSIEPGKDINRPTNARGWTHWHHLFNPRQLFLNGLLAKCAAELAESKIERVGALLSIGCVADWNSRLCRWHTRKIGDKSEQTFYKPSLSTPLFTYCSRGLQSLDTTFLADVAACTLKGSARFTLADARKVSEECDIWITDPPYADAVNYHELSEYFLAWYAKPLSSLFDSWYADSKRLLAIKADTAHNFRESMVNCYRQLVGHMADEGMQVVMFTHHDARVWADLTMILWAAGLRVSAAWCIATETDSTLKKGNFVQGTVLLACRKRTEDEAVFLDEINHRVEMEVRQQLDSMVSLDDASDPNFADADYQLAAYAAALRVLTERPIVEIDPEQEILRNASCGEVEKIEQVIRNAVKIACDHLVPAGIEREIWKSLGPAERFYLKGLEVETHGERRSGVYQELARGFGAADYAELLASDRANETRLKTAGEFGRRLLSGDGFASSLVRQILAAVHKVSASEQAREGLNWLKTELPDYWGARETIAHLLDFFAALRRVAGMEHWHKDSDAALLLAGAVRNDHI